MQSLFFRYSHSNNKWYRLKNIRLDQWLKNEDPSMSTWNFIHFMFNKDAKKKIEKQKQKLEKRKNFQQLVLGKLDVHMQKN